MARTTLPVGDRQRTAARRLAVIAAALAALVVAAAPALADVPVPRAKPGADAAGSAEAAIENLIDPAARGRKLLTDRLTSSLAPYAAARDGITGTPADVQSRLVLAARLSEDGPILAEGVTWRIFAEIPGQDGSLPLIRTAKGGRAEVTMRPGRYLVHAAFGRAGKSRLVEVDRPYHGETFVLDAGGLSLDARIEGGGALAPERLTFEIYAPGEFEEEARRLVAEARPGYVLPLPAGPYHVVSRYGATNAVRSADLLVSPGSLTAVTMHHRAADISLKLVSEPGGEALADTEWTILDEDGTELFSYVGAFPSLILAEGTYLAKVRHSDGNFVHRFEVTPGVDAEVEVLARGAPMGPRE